MQSTEELWRDIPGWERSHQISNRGNVRSKPRTVTYITGQKVRYEGRDLLLESARTGYRMIRLSFEGKSERYYVHRLVLETFIGRAPAGTECCHNNGNPADNRLENLRWGTTRENSLDRVRHGTHNHTRKTHCSRGHSLTAPNLVPSALKKGRRSCLACNRGVLFAKRKNMQSRVQEIADSYYEEIVK